VIEEESMAKEEEEEEEEEQLSSTSRSNGNSSSTLLPNWKEYVNLEVRVEMCFHFFLFFWAILVFGWCC
jgi:hypothetical protein